MRIFKNKFLNVIAYIILCVGLLVVTLLINQHFKMCSPNVVAVPVFNSNCTSY